MGGLHQTVGLLELSSKDAEFLFVTSSMTCAQTSFFSEREHVENPSVCLSVVCRLSVTFARPTQAIQISAILLCRMVPWPFVDIHPKFYGDRQRGIPQSGELNARGVAEYSDFEPIEGYISETVQDKR